MSGAVWTRCAQIDLARIDSLNRPNDPDFAASFGRAAIAAGEFLAEHPGAGPAMADGERKWLVPHTDYVIFHRIVGDGVQILRVYLGREGWRS
jgi:plasmid stabilization system protein ParE